MKNIFLSGLVSFFICVIIGPLIIPLLRKLKFRQSILQIGPKWHSKKSGTPTMGGIIFIIAIIISTILFVKDYKIIIILFTSLAFGIIGFIDDFIKAYYKRNLGLTARQKFSAQIIVSIIFTIYIYNTGIVNTEIYIPFTTLILDLEWLYIPFVVFVMLGTVNSVNLTDGLDGLAAGVTAVVAVFFTLTAFSFGESSMGVFSVAILGGCLGFLIFNSIPAKVFMGDTGSLFLGGAISAMAIMLKLPLILIIVGGIYLIETLSVILQVISFKLTGKRIFKMSPIHHHFEMIGWSERKVVIVFISITIILSIAGLYGINSILPYIN